MSAVVAAPIMPPPAFRAPLGPRSGPSTSRQSRTGAATASTTRPLTAAAIVSTARRLIVTRGITDGNYSIVVACCREKRAAGDGRLLRRLPGSGHGGGHDRPLRSLLHQRDAARLLRE